VFDLAASSARGRLFARGHCGRGYWGCRAWDGIANVIKAVSAGAPSRCGTVGLGRGRHLNDSDLFEPGPWTVRLRTRLADGVWDSQIYALVEPLPRMKRGSNVSACSPAFRCLGSTRSAPQPTDPRRR